jgi:glutathione S-transferase
MMTLFGSKTSPFVRRVRVVALEKELPYSLVDSTTDDGARRLQALSPIGKVPVARFSDGRIVFDSRVIIDELCRPSGTAASDERAAWAPLRAPFFDDLRARVEEENAINLVDEALLSLVRLFYLRRDGADLSVPYLQKEQQRAETILRALEDQVIDHHLTRRAADEGNFGRPELAAVTALHWMAFRRTFDVASTPKLAKLVEHWSSRRSLAATAPG